MIMRLNDKRIRFILGVSTVILILVFILPYFIVALYSLPRCDEYGHLYNITMQGGISPIKVWRNIIYQYRTWQGSYFSAIFCYGLNPIALFDTPDAISWFNATNFIIFAVSMIWLNSKLLSLVEFDGYVKHFLSVVISALMLSTRYMKELIVWISGFNFYTVVLIMGLASMYGLMMVDCEERVKRKQFILGVSYFGVFCSAGGVLQINVILLFLLAVVCIIKYCEKESYRNVFIGFIIELIGTIINVLSPGYYVRKQSFDTITFPKAGLFAIQCLVEEIKRIIFNTYIMWGLAFVFIIFLIAIRNGRDKVSLKPALIVLAGLICMFASTFPVVYGYAMPEMEDRGYGILDIMFIAWVVYFEMGICNQIKLKQVCISKKSVYVGLGIIIVSLIFTLELRLIPVSNMGAVKCIKYLVNGEVQDYSRYWRNISHQFAEEKGPDVVVEIKSEYLEKDSIIFRPDVQLYSDDWVNFAIASWYGYDTLTIKKVD